MQEVKNRIKQNKKQNIDQKEKKYRMQEVKNRIKQNKKQNNAKLI